MSRKSEKKARPGKAAATRFNPSVPSSGKRDWIFGLVLVLAIIVAYQPVWHAGFIWDDDYHLTNNSALHDFNGLKHIWFDTQATPQYYPLVHTTFWLEYHAWKLNPMGYHIVNVLLHALGAILLWRVLKRLEWSGAWLAAAVFALHPVNVESVAWITERKNVLSAVFFFAAAWAYLNFVGESERKKRRGWWWVALLLFVCALLSKTVACSLPAALLLVRWWKKKLLAVGDVLPTIPFFIVGLWLGLQTAWLEKHHAGASGAEWSFSFVERCLIAGRALWFYAGKLVWPAQLTFVYPRWQIDTGIWWQWLFPAAALASVAALWFARKRIGRGPLVAVLFFAVTLFPALGFLNVYPMRYSFVADHFQYLAEIGMIVPVTGGMMMALGCWKTSKPFLKPALYGLLLLTLGILTWRQCRMYANIETLWQTTIRLNPNCWMAHNNLGNALLQEGSVDEAITHFQQALQIKPDYADAHYNLGNALLQKRSVDEAIVHYQQALQIKPDYADAHNNFGNALLQKGRVDEAIAHYQQALQIKPDDVEAHINLGSALLQKGKVDEAIAHYQQALQIKPDIAEAHYNLGNTLLQKGKVDEAITHFQKALEIKPDYAEVHNNLGEVLLQKGSVDEAITHFQKALQLKPGFLEVHNNLAWVLATAAQASLRNGSQAVELAQRANQLAGGENPIYLHTLAAAYAEAGRFDDARRSAQKAMDLARAAGQSNLAERLNGELKLYKAGLPFHQESK
jgi:tetratricopeptide (TPR) repeat protein